MSAYIRTQSILNEVTPIKYIIIGCGESASIYSVSVPTTSTSYCDFIEPYTENGPMSEVVWFAIHKDHSVIARINSTFVSEVKYK